jgi:PIN domain nuclease of toxin-antitoxin system
MKILLDTHIWLWWIAAPDKIDSDAHKILVDRRNELFLSAASSWEISIKYGLGRLKLSEPPDRFIPPRLQRDGITALPINLIHTVEVANLPLHHRDPFDRIIIAQSRIEKIPIMTADHAFHEYDVEMQ